MACAVCAQVLFPLATATPNGDEVVAWLHRAELTGGPVDHIAVPVGVDEVHADVRCDFCSGPEPTWVLPVASFEAGSEHTSHQDWAACDACARLLRKQQWDRLTKRVVLASAARHRISPSEPSLIESVETLFAQVRENQSGPIRRSSRPQ